MHKYHALLLIAAVLAISGCIGQTDLTTPTCPSAGSSNGLVITDFAFAYSPVYAGEKIDLDSNIENVGGKRSTLQSIEIFGPDMTGEGQDAAPLKWGCPAPCGPDGSGMVISGNEITGPMLEPPDTTLDIPGDTYPMMWTLQAPKDLETPMSYDYNVRVKFGYSTVFSGVLTAVTSEYLRTLSKEDRDALINAGGLSQACTSGGPISITAAAGSHFVDPPAGTSITFKISNIGSGFTYWSEGDKTAVTDQTRYKIHVKPATGITCQDQAITLSKGKTSAFKCTFDAGTIQNKKDITFTVPIEYYYYVDSSTNILVEKALT